MLQKTKSYFNVAGDIIALALIALMFMAATWFTGHPFAAVFFGIVAVYAVYLLTPTKPKLNLN